MRKMCIHTSLHINFLSLLFHKNMPYLSFSSANLLTSARKRSQIRERITSGFSQKECGTMSPRNLLPTSSTTRVEATTTTTKGRCKPCRSFGSPLRCRFSRVDVDVVLFHKQTTGRGFRSSRRIGTTTNTLLKANQSDESIETVQDEFNEGTSTEEPLNWFRVVLAFLFPALGGLLFGFDIGATSGALVSLTSAQTGGVPWYDLTPLQSGLVVSSSLAGALISSVAAFFVGDEIGRRKEILLASGLYVLGTVLEAGASSYGMLVAGRTIYGLGIGFAMHGAPAYIAETAPQQVRGLLVSLKEVLIVVGILLGYLFSFLFVSTIEGWRLIYGVALPVAAALAAGMYWLPPSPRWLLLKSQPRTEVVESLRKLRGPQVEEKRLEEEVDLMEVTAADAKNAPKGFSALLRKENLKPLIIGLSLMIFQQITGQPSVLYYATKIFQEAGFAAAESATAVSVVLGVFKLVMTGIAVFTVDVYGRRPLLLTGVTGMVISLFLLGSVHNSLFSVVALLLYVGCYQISFGPVSWLLVGEIFPLAVRSSAIALASFANFGSNFLVSLVLPTIQSFLGVDTTYIAFGFIGIVAVGVIYLLVPETKGKSLEEIERMFQIDNDD